MLRRQSSTLEAPPQFEDGERDGRTIGGTCKMATHYVCGPVMHPDSRFRAGWNVGLAIFIMYCGISVPLEIAFDTDMGYAMCGRTTLRENCANFLTWFGASSTSSSSSTS